MARCPDNNVIADFVSGELDAPIEALVERHVAECEGCRVLVSELVRLGRSGLLVEQQRSG